ncbi:cell wall hydrolase [Thermoactinomyces sp. DSM 45892]|uniref:cell wall hydrolase n=1 Tax=Thermoactinomyces sp. DSM 45892 TaxID=1882753 RepID=UPI000897F492|nr:cell wall hydrolase [Thermoactinomyces sp. DSM 45892]SDY25932.1 N-acetylmuramoyl-L-alanine amidase [Thermoactinomyces sp. DSM 45892]
MDIKRFVRRWGLFSLGMMIALTCTTVFAKKTSSNVFHIESDVPFSMSVPTDVVHQEMSETIAKAAPEKKITTTSTHKDQKINRDRNNSKIDNKSNVELLARAVYSEARGEEFQGQVAVASVIINRTESGKFPRSIRGVIFQKNAFTAVSDGQFWLKPDAEAYQAAKLALNGSDPTDGALYYYNPKTATSKWMTNKAEKSSTKRIGNHVFMK